MKRFSQVAVAGAAAAIVLQAAACDPFVACTEMACFDGLMVEISGGVTGPVTVTALTADTAISLEASRRITHVGADQVDTTYLAYFTGLHPAEVTLRILAASDTLEVTVYPQYETLRPNGEHCDPVCRSSKVTVSYSSSLGTRATSEAMRPAMGLAPPP